MPSRGRSVWAKSRGLPTDPTQSARYRQGCCCLQIRKWLEEHGVTSMNLMTGMATMPKLNSDEGKTVISFRGEILGLSGRRRTSMDQPGDETS